MAQTIPGGQYRGTDGLLHDANGKLIQEPEPVVKPAVKTEADPEPADVPVSPKKKK